jgi:hypothetical protein
MPKAAQIDHVSAAQWVAGRKRKKFMPKLCPEVELGLE